MAHSAFVLLLAFLAGVAAVAGAAAAVPGGGCEVSALAAEVVASCAATRPCCEPVLSSVELGGGACLCRVAAEMPVLHAGLNGSALLALYASCGDGGATACLLVSCHGAPPAGGSLVAALLSAATGARVAGVVKDRPI